MLSGEVITHEGLSIAWPRLLVYSHDPRAMKIHT